MIIDMYKNIPDFPFDRYFERANEYIQAQSYWLRVLRSAPGFDDREWHPKYPDANIPDNMYTGRVCFVTSPQTRKEIDISTVSITGYANMLFRENSGYTEEEYLEQKKLFGNDFILDEQTLRGMTYEESLKMAQETSDKYDLTTWVEKAIRWQPDPKHPEGGYEMDVERLILTSEISERAEPKAIQALELFLQPGPAMDRVNNVFSPE